MAATLLHSPCTNNVNELQLFPIESDNRQQAVLVIPGLIMCDNIKRRSSLNLIKLWLSWRVIREVVLRPLHCMNTAHTSSG